jgi:mono/diheme cytochrome c family protein
MMHTIACANCHGSDGKGGRVNMMMWSFNVPDITWDKLTGEEHHEEQENGEQHEEHPPYTEETLKSAITGGINPAGEPLDEEMPRWKMSTQDLNDLVNFIKTLK